MEGEERLVFFDKTLNSDAADMDVEGGVVDHLAVECCAV